MEKTINNKSEFKCINFLLVFYIIYSIFVTFTACRYLTAEFNFYSIIFLTALISFSFVLIDIVAEVYGIKISAIFYFSMIFTRMIIATFFCISYSHLVVTKYLLFAAFYHPLIFTFSWYINVRLLTKWKILMHGKYFWLRSIGASVILISIFCLFSIIEDKKFSNWSSATFISTSILDYIFRMLFIIIFAFPANFITNILKVIEYQDKNTNGLSFNPFRSSIKIQ